MNITIGEKFLKAETTIKAAWTGGVENRDYGHLHILNEYAGVEFDLPIMGRLQHGWYGLVKEEHYYKNNLLPTFVWTRKAEDAAKALGWTNYHAIGAPWLYLLKNLETWGFSANSYPKDIRTTDELWVFSLHSTSMKNDYGVDETDIYEFINRAVASPARKKIVLLTEYDYYKYQLLDMKIPPSLSVVSLGPRTGDSSSFAHLHKLFFLLSNTKKVLVDYPTVLLFYAITIGCEVQWVRNRAYDITYTEVSNYGNLEILKFMTEDHLKPELSLNFALKTLGADQLKTPNELRHLFHWDRINHNFRSRVPVFAANILSLLRNLK